MNKILAVIVTYNRSEMLKGCINHLLRQSEPQFDILVINNNSTDGTKDYLLQIKNHRIQVINCEENIGGAGGFNLGLRYSVDNGYYYAWLMDDDVYVEHDALEKLIEAGRQIRNWGYLASVVLDRNDKLCILNLPKYKKNKKNIYEYKQIKTSTFVSFFVKTSVVKNVGLPIKDFFIWNDDIEYTLRISDKYPCFEIEKSKVVHMVEAGRGNSIATDNSDRIDRYFLAYRNDCFLYRKRGIKGILFFSSKCIYNLVRIVFCARNNRLRRMKVLIKGAIAGISFNPNIEKL